MSNRTNKPTLGALSFILRHKELWPEGFRWDYTSCCSCAMGLAHAVWSQDIQEANCKAMVKAFGMKQSDAENIFFHMRTGTFAYGIKPEQVADAIDALCPH